MGGLVSPATWVPAREAWAGATGGFIISPSHRPRTQAQSSGMATGPHLLPAPLGDPRTGDHCAPRSGQTLCYQHRPPVRSFSSQPPCRWLRTDTHVSWAESRVGHSILCSGADRLGLGARPGKRSMPTAPLKLCAVAPSGSPQAPSVSELWVQSGASAGQEAQEEAGRIGHSATTLSPDPWGGQDGQQGRGGQGSSPQQGV